ncbi:hypothetical protein DFH06DRAFT_1122839 [Mycena polygramma]|nr:hypothetical protein DFH06DRAFT_1127772 [Mycena polygramma]KAJ7676089.1 hypothetical protein DFH06DRAFT_1122839 [Mycena polygramma]
MLEFRKSAQTNKRPEELITLEANYATTMRNDASKLITERVEGRIRDFSRPRRNLRRNSEDTNKGTLEGWAVNPLPYKDGLATRKEFPLPEHAVALPTDIIEMHATHNRKSASVNDCRDRNAEVVVVVMGIGEATVLVERVVIPVGIFHGQGNPGGVDKRQEGMLAERKHLVLGHGETNAQAHPVQELQHRGTFPRHVPRRRHRNPPVIQVLHQLIGFRHLDKPLWLNQSLSSTGRSKRGVADEMQHGPR